MDVDLIYKSNLEKIGFDNVEITVESGSELLTMLLSTVYGVYMDQEVILLSLFDISEQKKVENALKRISIRDELTGLYNRHFLENIIDEEIYRSQRYEISLSAMLIDLDRFKSVNDNFGHPIGDLVLKHTANLITRAVRKSDYAIRIGGEEFLVLMPNTNMVGVVIAAENLRKTIEKELYPEIGKITVSIGVGELDNSEKYVELYKRLDDALYLAKENGRNRIEKSIKGDIIDKSLIFKWNKKWNSGEEKIDSQHQKLINLCSEFANTELSKKGKDYESQYFDEIIKHIIEHFEYEEKILSNIGYYDIVKHKIIHKELANKALEIKYAYLNNNYEGKKVFSFLFDDVIIKHLLCEDIKFFNYFKK